MSTHSLAAALQVKTGTSDEKLLLIYIAEGVDNDGHFPETAVAALFTWSLLPEHRFQRALAGLKAKGWYFPSTDCEGRPSLYFDQLSEAYLNPHWNQRPQVVARRREA